MTELSIRELTDIVSGQLSLGTMPPLDGPLTPAGSIVVDSRAVEPGNVFWALRGARCDGAHFAEDALLRGAHGTIVAGRHIEPWAGRFSIRVRDGRRALLRLGSWARQEFTGSVIAFAAGRDSRFACRTMQSILSPLLPGPMRVDDCRGSVGAVLGMLEWKKDDKCAVVEIGDDQEPEIDEISHLCRPQIAVITRTRKTHRQTTGDLEAFAETQTRLLHTLPRDAVAVLDGDDPWARGLALKYSRKVLWVGHGDECDLQATCHASGGDRLTFDLDGVRFVAPAGNRTYVTTAMMAIAVGRLLGLRQADLQSALESLPPVEGHRAQRHKQYILEVPSSVLALREANATLPPGLERYAC